MNKPSKLIKPLLEEFLEKRDNDLGLYTSKQEIVLKNTLRNFGFYAKTMLELAEQERDDGAESVKVVGVEFCDEKKDTPNTEKGWRFVPNPYIHDTERIKYFADNIEWIGFYGNSCQYYRYCNYTRGLR